LMVAEPCDWIASERFGHARPACGDWSP
jgi:hypothetical protein